MKRIRNFVLMLLGIFVVSLCAYAAGEMSASINSAKLKSQYGVQLAAQGARVVAAVGQTLDATVTNAVTLAKCGLKGDKTGEAIKVTLLEGKKFKLMHVPSGNEVTMNFNDEITDYARPTPKP
jgi:hypothetical protein